MSEHNKALIRRFYEAWNEGKMEVVVGMIAPNFVDHVMPAELAFGREGFLKARESGRRALADVHIEVVDVFGEGDYVISRVIIHATQVGTFQGIPATGRRFALEAISILRLENDQLVEHWECSDFRGLLRQVGAKVVLENGD